MKQIILILAILFTTSLTNISNAQNNKMNLDRQPAWGPTGYDYVEYYYFPDINVYFDINSSLFYYLSKSKWVSDRYLPEKYKTYDLYSLYKVVIEENQAWLNNKTHKKKYSKYKNNKSQAVIKNSNDKKYNNSKNNSVNWVNNKDKSSNSQDKSSNNQNKQNNQNQKQTPNNKNNNGR